MDDIDIADTFDGIIYTSINVYGVPIEDSIELNTIIDQITPITRIFRNEAYHR